MKNKIIAIIFICIIFGFSLTSIIAKDNLLSTFERRKLAQFPKLDKDFTGNLDDYLLDQFIFRNKLINLNSFINRKILNKIDNNDVYVIGDNIYDKTYPLNEKQTTNFTKKINYIIENYCNNSNVYYSIIPDKNYFIAEENYLKLNYDKMYNIITSRTNGKYINITDDLDIEDYYRTDIHWKQENLSDVVKEIVKAMGKEYKPQTYIQKQYNEFYGASYSKAGMDLEPDILTYLYSQDMKNVTVTHLEFGGKSMYDTEKLTSLDAYDVFLSGPSSYIEIENSSVTDGSTLILFRDSFGSSIAPLLTSYYNKIILVDLRYIDFNIAKEKLNFENADVLFLYSTLIVNSSNVLKVNVKNGIIQ